MSSCNRLFRVCAFTVCLAASAMITLPALAADVEPTPPSTATAVPTAAPPAVAASEPVAAPAAAPASPPPAGTVRRYRPSSRSTAEIREEAAQRPYALDFGERLDSGHDQLYVNVQRFVENTDRRFAPPDAELLPVPATPFRLGIVTQTVDRPNGVKFDVDLNLDVTLRLPNIEQRLRIFITNDDVAEAPDRAGERSNLRAGLRFNPRGDFDFDLGVRGDLPPVAFATLRWSKFFAVGRSDLYPFAKLFAQTDEGLGFASGFTLDRRLGETTIARSSSYAKWRKDTAEIGWAQVLLLARAEELLVPDRYGRLLRNQDLARAWGVQVLASGERRNAVEYYEASLFYKRPLRHRWLYGYVEPLVRWDRRYAWSADPGIRIGIEALFWDLSRSRRNTTAAPIPLSSPAARP